MSRVVATVGAIPGAGATTAVSAIGAALAEQRCHVALVDASTEGSRLADVLDLDGDGELADALRRRADLTDVQASGPHGVRAYPAAPETNWDAVRPGAVATTYDRLRDTFDVVLVDCGSELTPAAASWIGYADELLVVTSPDVADAVADVAAMGAAFDVPVRGVLANRVVPDEAERTLSALGSTPHEALGLFPEDPAVGAAADARESVLAREPDSQIAACAWQLAERLREDEHSSPVVPGGWNVAAGGDRLAGDDRTANEGGRSTVGDDDTTTSDGSVTGGSDGSGVDVTSDDTGPERRSDAAGADRASDAAGADRPSDGSDDGGERDGERGGDADATGAGTPAGDEPSDAATSSSASVAEAGASPDGGTVGEDEATAFEWSGSGSLADDVGASLADAESEHPSSVARSADGGAAGADGGSGGADDGSGRASSGGADDGSGRASSGGADDGSTSAGDATPADERDAVAADREVADDESADGGGVTEAEISDEEIEEVFKETMERVKAERDGED